MSRHHPCEEELDSHVPLLTDHEHHGLQDGNHSPALSTLSAQSHEIKYIFEPCVAQAEREADCNSDYSHINIRPKPRAGDGVFSGRPPPYSRYEHEGNLASHYGFQHGLVSGNIQRFRSQPQTFSLEDVSGYDPTRRKSWSPPFSRHNVQGYQAGHRNVRGCHSSNMIDWEGPQHGMAAYEPHGYHPQGHPPSHLQGHPPAHRQGLPQGHMQGHTNSNEVECLPPRLAPVSGVLSEVGFICIKIIWVVLAFAGIGHVCYCYSDSKQYDKFKRGVSHSHTHVRAHTHTVTVTATE